MKRFGTITTPKLDDLNNTIQSIFAKYKSIGVAIHDAGASEIISEICSLLSKDVDISYYLSGPAIQIFNRKSLNVKNNSEISEIMNSDLILTGTGWETDVESIAIENSKKNNIPCYVVLDHFQHFRSRFKKKDGQWVFPDKIIVTNLYTFHVVKNEISEVPVIHTEDIYIESLLKKNTFLSKDQKSKSHEILYLSDGQPYYQKSEFSQISQIAKIEKNCKQIAEFIRKDFSKVSVRPHPADLNVNKAPAKIGGMYFEEVDGDLETLINKSILIIGTDSLAMYVAMKLGARTLTLIHDSEKPLWLDFAASLESINKKNTQESINTIFLCDDQTGVYVRKFSLMDIDNLHLKNRSIDFAREFNGFVVDHNSFESYFYQVYKRLDKEQMYYSVMNSSNKRIGIIAIRFFTFNSVIVLRPLIYFNVTGSKDFNSGIDLLINFLKVNFSDYGIKTEK